ncbi:MAG: hypothetical protein U1E29_18065 [Coriobacteriia bacterium]|nr:hypothetical protein [Coriobacteriia bacterium]
MGRVIGAASEFYRLRVVRVDDSDEPDLEWRDDILYRTPPTEELEECESWALEAVDVADEDSAHVVARFTHSDDAHVALNEITEDLQELTKSGFEARYLT